MYVVYGVHLLVRFLLLLMLWADTKAVKQRLGNDSENSQEITPSVRNLFFNDNKSAHAKDFCCGERKRYAG